MANNDWYKPHEKDVVMALKKGKSAAKEDAVTCNMVRMKEGAFFICAHVSAPKAGGMVKEARNVGGKVVAAGRLFLGEEGPTFEVDDGDLSVKQRFSTAAAGLGSPMSVVVRAAPGSPAEAAAAAAAASAAPPVAPPASKASPQSAAPRATPPPAPSARPQAAAPSPSAPTMETMRAALAKLVPAVQQAVKAHPEQKNELLQPIARCKKQIEDGQAAEAKATLSEVVALLKGLGPAAPTPVPPAAPPAQAPAPEAAPPSSTADFMARAKVLKAEIAGLSATDSARAADLSRLLLKAAASAKAKDHEAAQAALDAVKAGLAAPSLPPSSETQESEAEESTTAEQQQPEGRATPPDEQAAPDTEPKTPAGRWEAEQVKVLAELKDVIKEVAGSNDPEAGQAEFRLKAVMKQLSGKMETQQQATEMERYLEDDEIVATVCNLAFDLKTPMLKVLKEIKPQLTA